MFDDLSPGAPIETRRRAYKSPIPADAVPTPIPAQELDKEGMVQMHHRFLDLYVSELDRQYDNRREQAKEEDIYDNIQWDDEDAQTLRDRGQIPLVYNVVSSTIDWITGTEQRTRTDFRILPRSKEDAKPAERKTEILKYLADVNRTEFAITRAFEDAAKIGIGWLEDGVTDGTEFEPLYTRYENWRNIVWDSTATQLDVEDGRYIFRTKWVDLDVAKAYFEGREAIVEQAARESQDFMGLDTFGDEVMDQPEIELELRSSSTTSDRIHGYQRRRVRLIEGWIKLPKKTYRLKGGPFDRELFDPYSPGHVEMLNNGVCTLTSRVSMRMYVAVFTTAGMLYFGPSPYRHNKFPFTPIWGYKRGRDGLPYGVMRRIKDLQVDVNKRASKALYILSTNKVIMDKGAVDDLDEFAEENSRPDAILVKNKGYELVLNADRELSQYQLELMSRSIQMIQSAGGVTDEALGRTTNAVSGIAIERRQQQASLATSKLFGHLQFARQVQGEKQLCNVEQFMKEEKQFRITNKRGTPQYVTINDGLPENDVVRSKADYVISEADWQQSMREAAVQQLLEASNKFPPEVLLVMLDLIVENMDLPNREELVRRIRQVTGQRDPDAEEPTPEEQAQAQAKQEADALTRAMAVAELRKKVAEAGKAEAAARQLAAKIVGDNVDAQNKALAAARDALLVPQAAPIADHILAESGFKAQSDLEGEVANPPPVPQAAPLPPPTQPNAQQPVGLG